MHLMTLQLFTKTTTFILPSQKNLIEYYTCSMKIILYILLALAALFLLWIAGIFIHTFYRLATGKMSKEEQDFHLRQYEKMKKERKAKKRKSSSFSYPSPLNEMFWP